MRKTEQKLWDRMRTHLGQTLRLERQENLVSVGDPDVIVTAPRNWVTRVELKAVEKFPARPGTRVLGSDGLSIAQRNWHMEHKRRGGVSYILVGVGSHEFFTIDGGLHDAVNDMTRDDLYEFTYASNWDALRALLDPSWRRK